MASGTVFDVEEVGIFTPKMAKVDELTAGEVGYVAANIKDVRDARVGDTVTLDGESHRHGLPGFQRRPAHGVLCGSIPCRARITKN
jgi:GTP-binding protein LepA